MIRIVLVDLVGWHGHYLFTHWYYPFRVRKWFFSDTFKDIFIFVLSLIFFTSTEFRNDVIRYYDLKKQKSEILILSKDVNQDLKLYKVCFSIKKWRYDKYKELKYALFFFSNKLLKEIRFCWEIETKTLFLSYHVGFLLKRRMSKHIKR